MRVPRNIDEINQFMHDATFLSDEGFRAKWGMSYRDAVSPAAHVMLVMLHDEILELQGPFSIRRAKT